MKNKNKIFLCAICNVESGTCNEDCKFCTQSVKYKADIQRYKTKAIQTIVDEIHGIGQCPSKGLEAAKTNWIMQNVCGACNRLSNIFSVKFLFV